MPAGAGIDEEHEVLRRAVTRGGRKIAGDLVAPGAEERMLHDGHQLDVRETHLDHVIGQFQRHLAIVERTIAILEDPTPGTQVYFVDRPGRIQGVDPGAVAAPLEVLPLVRIVPDDGAGPRRLLTRKA